MEILYDIKSAKDQLRSTGVTVMSFSNVDALTDAPAGESVMNQYIKEINKYSLKDLIQIFGGCLFLNTTVNMYDDQLAKLVPGTEITPYDYDTECIPKIKEKILEINKTMEGKELTSVAADHDSQNNQSDQNDIPLWDFYGPYEKLTILRKYIVDNFKSSVFQMWYRIELPNTHNKDNVSNTVFTMFTSQIHEELTKIYLELYGDLEEVQNFGREYNSNTTLQQTFRLQVYEEGCFLSPHRDGGGGHCSMLLYTNEDYVEGMGGELVCIDSKGKEIIVPPTIGLLAIVDFKKDPSHSVNIIKGNNWNRRTIGCWWPAGVQY